MSHKGASTSVEGSVMHVARDNAACVEWKIPHFLDLPHNNQQRIESPTFVLSDAEWFIRIYPNETNAHVYMFIQKTCSSRPLRVSYSIEVLKADGSVFKSFHKINKFGKEECYSNVFKFPRSEILGTRGVVLPEGALTVLCSISILDKIAKSISTEVACQTQSLDGLETLSQNFKELFLDGAQGDITFNVQGKAFLAHKSVLAARSTVFSAMLKTDMVEKNDGIVDISDSHPDSFNDFLLHVYSGNLDMISPRNAVGLYMLADKYNLKQLKNACCECLTCDISVNSFCDIALLASLHNETKLMETVKEFFNKNASAILPTSEWTSFMAEHLTLANELLIQMANAYKKYC